MSILKSFKSPAKVNLFLRVLKKREDGYHDILSLMQAVSIYDEIILEIQDGLGIIIKCDNSAVPCDKTNLAYKAAEQFVKVTGLSKKIYVEIKKNIPVAAGLGGGSSNAATVLMGLNEVTESNIDTDKLQKIGSMLGADVPFFISKRASIARGIGDILEPIELPKFWFVLINPLFHVSTEWAYKNLNLTKSKEDINITVSKVLSCYSLNRLQEHDFLKSILINDLEFATIGKHPEITEIKNALLDVGAAGALMSGSGPTVFGIFQDKGRAADAFRLLKASFKQKKYLVFLAHGI